MGKAVKPQMHSAGLPTETPALSTNPGQEKLWEAAFPQGGDPALLDPALLPGQGGAGKGKQSALRGLSRCWAHPCPAEAFPCTAEDTQCLWEHHRRGTQTCRRLQLLQDGGDSQLLLLCGGTQVLMVQQLEQNTELWQELVQH